LPETDSSIPLRFTRGDLRNVNYLVALVALLENPEDKLYPLTFHSWIILVYSKIHLPFSLKIVII